MKKESLKQKIYYTFNTKGNTSHHISTSVPKWSRDRSPNMLFLLAINEKSYW